MEDLQQQIDSTINDMNEDEVFILTTRPVGGGKVQLEFAEIIPTPASEGNVLGEFNKSDERFSGRAARRAWLSAEPEDVQRILPEIMSEVRECLDSGEKVFVGYKNPQMPNGDSLKIQVEESHTPENEWEMNNLDRSAKQNGEGEHLLKDGKLIFSHTSVVRRKANHVFIEHEETTTTPFHEDYDMRESVGSSIAQEEEEEVGERVEA